MKTTITINGITKEIELTEEQAKMFEKREFKRWRAPKNDSYLYVADCDYIGKTFEWGEKYDGYRYSTGNYFKTRGEAEKYRDTLLATQRVNDRIMKLNEGWVADWDDVVQQKWIIEYDCGFRCDYWTTTRNSLTLSYMKSFEIAEQIIKEFPKELKLIFGV